jgi:hypothetical protein
MTMAASATKRAAPVWSTRAVVMGSSKCQARPPTDHFEKLLDGTFPNHAYPIKHKLRENNMMKSFVTSGSLSRSMEVNEVLNEDGMTPFHEEDMVMMIYDGCPSPGRHCVTPTFCKVKISPT